MHTNVTPKTMNLMFYSFLLNRDFSGFVEVYAYSDGRHLVKVPTLPGCLALGKSQGEALINIVPEIELHIMAMINVGKEVPDEE